MEKRSGEACALRERRPLVRNTGTNAGIRVGVPDQRSPAVMKRPGPRHDGECSESLSASPRLCVYFFECLCGLCGSKTGREGGFVISLCLRAFVFATWVGGSVSSLCSPCLCGFSPFTWHTAHLAPSMDSMGSGYESLSMTSACSISPRTLPPPERMTFTLRLGSRTLISPSTTDPLEMVISMAFFLP